MNALTALANGAMGVAYMVIGALVVIDLARGWRRQGASPIGFALVGLAYTCGPHHLDHALHLLDDGRAASALDLYTVAVGLPPGALFALLSVEGFRGGPGDRAVVGTPTLLAVIPPLLATNVAIVIAGTSFTGESLTFVAGGVPNVILVGVYTAIAAVLAKAQVATRAGGGTWSVSGLSLAGIFATCAPMHAVVAFYTASGRYERDAHGIVIDSMSIPAGLFFLWVAWRLGRGELRDWERTAAPAMTS